MVHVDVLHASIRSDCLCDAKSPRELTCLAAMVRARSISSILHTR